MFLAGVLFSVLALIPLGSVYLHLTPVGFEGNVSLQGSGVQGGGNEQAEEMCGHGISSESLHDVFRAVPSSPRSRTVSLHGLVTQLASDRAKLDSFLNRCKLLLL